MNQIFNLKRFFKYVASYLWLNKWYLTITALLFMVSATLFSLFNEAPGVLMTLSLGIAIVALRTNLPDGPQRHLLPESTVIEKFVTESLIKIAFVAIPFAIHAAFIDGSQSLFTDGFQIEYLTLIWVVMWAATPFATVNFTKKDIGSTAARFCRAIMTLNVVFATLNLAQITTHALDSVPDYPALVNWLLLTVGTALFVLSYYLFKKRFDDYNKSDKINED